jgi:hypothetical protein
MGEGCSAFAGLGIPPRALRDNMDLTANQRPADPLPGEIREMCEQIRRAWTVQEKRKRAAWADTGPWTPPEVSVLLLADVGIRGGTELE